MLVATTVLVGAFLPTASAAADPLTITVIVVEADVDGVAVTFTAAGLKRGDEVDVVTLTYTGVGNTYGPSAEPPSKVGKYRVQPSAAVFAKGSAASYDITYVGANFEIVIPQSTPLPTVEVVTQAQPSRTPKATTRPSTSPSPTVPEQTPVPTTTVAGSVPAADLASDVQSQVIDTTTPAALEPSPVESAEAIAPQVSEPYSLARNAETAVNGQIALYTLLATAGFAAHRQQRRSRRDDESDQEKERAELGGVKAGSLAAAQDSEGWGDRSRTWRLPLTSGLDAVSRRTAIRFSRWSPVLSRVVLDGSYLRAMLGSAAVITYPLGVALALIALQQRDTTAIVPASLPVLAILFLAMFDAGLGMVASITYGSALLVAGAINTLQDAFALFGLAILWFAPPLIASAFRPLRRNVESTSSAWERATDYLLVLLLTRWAITSMVSALPALAGEALPIAAEADRFGLFAAAAIGGRMLLEDLAYYAYPRRLAEQHIAAPKPARSQRIWANLLRTGLFAIVAAPFTGASITLLIATAMFALPLTLSLFDAQFPKSALLAKLLPRATARTVVMAVLGTLFATWVKQFFNDPAEWAAWSFVLLGVPGLALTLLDFMSADPQPRVWTRSPLGIATYRLGGVAMFVLLWQVQQGVDLVAWLFN